MPNYKFPAPPPKEALEYYRAKKIAEGSSGFDYRDIWKEEHAYTFTVAKATQADVLNDIHAAVDKAQAQGQTFRDFQKELEPILKAKGWWGKKKMSDPLTGEIKNAQLGSNRRLKTIYEANIRSARSAGVWERAQRTKRAMPYFIYKLGPSKEHRLEHTKWNNVCLPIDDPFWQTHFTPNGWGCKCYIRQVSKYEYAKHKDSYTIESPAVKNKEWLNKRTGEVEKIPEGIDPGWNTNPGLARQSNVLKSISSKLNSLSEVEGAKGISAAKVIAKQLVDSQSFLQWYKKPQGHFPIASVTKKIKKELPVKTNVVLLSKYTRSKQIKNHSEFSATEYLFLQQILDEGIYYIDGRGGKENFRNIIWQKGQSGFIATIKVSNAGEIFVESLFRISRDSKKRLKEIARIERRQAKK